MKKILLSLISLASFSAFSQWTTQNTGFTASSRGIESIDIVDANTVWALAYDGSGGGANVQEFTRTTNGGTTWTPGTINLGNTALQITNISAVSATTAWVGAFDPTAGLGGTWKTTNAGVTWTKQNTTAYSTAGASWFDFVHFFDANNGVAMGDPGPSIDFEIYLTSDGGTTWTSPNAITLPNPQTDEYGYNGGYAAAGNTLWFVTNKGRIYKTTNMGVNWSVTQSPIADFGSAAISGKIYFSDNNNGVLLSSATTGNYYTTTNGGTTWSTPTTFTGSHKLLSFVPGTTTLVGTSAGTPSGSSYSSNTGTTWTNIDASTTTQRGVNAFLNGSTGWCGGFSTNSTTGGIFKYNGAALANQQFDRKVAFEVSPNPAKDVIGISNSDNVILTDVSINDINGRTVKTLKVDNLSEVQINISDLNSGIYFMNITSESGTSVKKFIKN